MAAMSTALVEFSDSGDSRTYTLTGHTASFPKLLVQKRKVPVGNQIVAEVSVEVISATKDAADLILPQRVGFKATVRYPISGTDSDITSMLAIFRDVVAGDEFAATVTSQNWLK
jgi:hypothetical protein